MQYIRIHIYKRVCVCVFAYLICISTLLNTEVPNLMCKYANPLERECEGLTVPKIH